VKSDTLFVHNWYVVGLVLSLRVTNPGANPKDGTGDSESVTRVGVTTMGHPVVRV
jgi:hypothetical protein